MKTLLAFLFLLTLCASLPALAEESDVGGITKRITTARPVILLAQTDEAVPLDQGKAAPSVSSPEEDSQDLFDEYNNSAATSAKVADPLYYFNYAMYGVNDFFYFYALKPVAQGYSLIVPTPVRNGVGNFFNNLMFPVRFINCLLQGKGQYAADEFSSFLLNTTIGILGFCDYAQKHKGIKPHTEDLGQTLATYKIGDGCYLVLPLFGPSTLRDAVGRAGDYFATPLTYATPWELAWGASGLEKINYTSLRIGDYEALKAASLDPYVAIRNAYIQNRRSQIDQ